MCDERSMSEKKSKSASEQSTKKESDETCNKNEKIESSKLLQLPRTWMFLMTFRLLINIFGQRSYIHPDEFFQGLEVIAGNLFKCEDSVIRPWEFQFKNATNQATGMSYIQEPIRNIAIPYLFYGAPLSLLKFLNSLLTIKDYSILTSKLENGFTITPVQANTLIYYPRVFITLCSVIVDFTILKSSEEFGLDGFSVLVTFATSYLSMVFMTRTFSNTIETMLFSVLIYLVIKSIKSQRVLNDKFLVASEHGKSSTSTLIASSSDFVKSTFQKERSSTRLNPQKSDTLKRIRLFDIFKSNYLGDWIGFVVCIGFFNRPTFLFFATIPLGYWILYGLDGCNSFQQFISFIFYRCLSLIKLALPCLIFLVLFDTMYYLELTSLNQVVNLLLKHDQKLVITPYNFFLYNSNTENLKSHGKHPFYLHAAVNCFILFGLNHFVIFLINIKFFSQLWKSLWQVDNESACEKYGRCRKIKNFAFRLYQIAINNQFCYLLFSYLIPLILFSTVAHQEPRFLLPLIIPICLLTGHCTFGKNSYMILRMIWLGFNMLGLIFYGYIHQGGVVNSLNYVQKMFTHISNLEIDQHVIYYNTYMPPRFLVAAPFSANIINNKRYVYEKNIKNFEDEMENGNFEAKFRSGKPVYPPERKVYDLMSSGSLDDVQSLILEIKKNSTSPTRIKMTKVKRNLALFFITPSVIDAQLVIDNGYGDSCDVTDSNKGAITFQIQTRFGIHFSGEHLKEQLDLMNCKFDIKDLTKRKCLEKKCRQYGLIGRFLNAFSLNFYQVIL